jgi:hypothetical protein
MRAYDIQSYLTAVARHREPRATIAHLDAHAEMLLDLGGNLFCLLPEVDWYLRRSIAHFGALDQYFEELRELVEEGRLTRCHFPVDVLARFSVRPRDFVEGRWCYRAECAAFMRYWLDRYLPTLRREAQEFIAMESLPPPLAALRKSCLRRHRRIERILRESAFDLNQTLPASFCADAASSSVAA